ncbi:MAG TPA: hypothetical protein EYH19_03475 [Desulfocapsa sulfexigens]|nr:hypothetical protein [Desulfocapsa sulfexigens]
MKKVLAITALVSIIGLTGFYQASAYRGHGGMRGHNGCNGQAMGMQVPAQMDEATKTKFDVFFKDTQDLRKSIVVKSAQKRALMNSKEPNIEKVSELAGELFDLRVSMRAKAEAAGLGDVIGQRRGCGNCDGPGFHHGRKGMVRGKGMQGGQVPAVN